MKICTKCKMEQPFEMFARANTRKSGYQPSCKVCNAKYRLENADKLKVTNAEYYDKNRIEILEQKKEYYLDHRSEILDHKVLYHEMNREKILEYRQKYREENIEKIKEWELNNKHTIAKNSANRRARKLNATPTWLTEDEKMEIIGLYFLCKIISEDTGIEHHVDHIVPLKGKTVCGLHVPWNLRIITARENISKGNRLDQNIQEF
jgi:5-methylcytosine-specific restriction endonuclease McrA